MPELDWGYGDPAVLREAYASDRRAIAHSVADNVTIDRHTGPFGPRIRFKPNEPQGTPILYFHGGGWVAGSPETHITLCSWLAHLSGREVLSLSYGLCPEYTFPHQVHDAARQLDDVLKSWDSVIVAGDSAGAAMAFWGESHAFGRDRVAAVVSLYGAFGALQTRSMSKNGDQDGLKARDVLGMYERLGCPGGQGMLDAIRPDGAPALLVTAGDDPLADDHKVLASKLDRPVTEIIAPGQPHAFLQFCGLEDAPRQTMADVAHWLKNTCPV